MMPVGDHNMLAKSYMSQEEIDRKAAEEKAKAVAAAKAAAEAKARTDTESSQSANAETKDESK